MVNLVALARSVLAGVTHGVPLALKAASLCMLLLSMTGCNALLHETTANVAGIGGAAAAQALTNNAAAATGIGLGIRSVADAGLQLAERRFQKVEQDAIAQVAGGLAPDEVGEWRTFDGTVGVGQQGSVVVSRDIGADQFQCREIVFSVDDQDDADDPRSYYTTTICKDVDRWEWALAEPATSRWGSLQ